MTAQPQFGMSARGPGRANCALQDDGWFSSDGAVLVRGKAAVTISNGTIECIDGTAILLEASANGVPSLQMNGTIVEDALVGLHALAGTAAIANSTFQYNSIGVEQDTDDTNIAGIDLSGGAIGGINVVACNTTGIGDGGGMPGVSVINLTSNVLSASNVNWDTPGPDQFSCDSTLLVCKCLNTACATAPGADGMDAVSESTGTINTAGNGLAPTCVQ